MTVEENAMAVDDEGAFEAPDPACHPGRAERVEGFSGYRLCKRAFDIALSVAVIAVGFVPGLLLSIVIAIDTKGSPIFTQVRIGKGGKPFRIYKFRTMFADSDNLEKYLNREQLSAWKKERKIEDDPRVTRLGRLLRKAYIDELPQFLNVLLNHMSTVGVRPVTEAELGFYGDDKSDFLSVKPGITGYWQTGVHNDAVYEDGSRQAAELYYVRNCSLKMDCYIFLKTFSAIFNKTGY